MPSFAPLSPSIPHTLAPSSPLPSTFTAHTHTLAARLSRTDAPRRKSGVVHHAPQGLGLPELVCTAFEGDWEGQRPGWVVAERGEQVVENEEKLGEEGAWRELGVDGIPRDMDEWEVWERIKRDWRDERKKRLVRCEQDQQAAIISKKLEERMDCSSSDERRKKSTATPSSASRPSQPTLLTSHFSSTKASTFSSSSKKPPPAPPAADSSKKKRPPSSPPAQRLPGHPPHRHAPQSPSSRESDAPAATGKSGDSGRPGRESFPSLTSINSADRSAEVEAVSIGALSEESDKGKRQERRAANGGDEEILFEGGYTQMVLPDPTPSSRPAASTSAAAPRSSNAHSPYPHLPPAKPPWSSPGLHANDQDSHGNRSTPVPLARPQPLPQSQTSTSSRSSRSPSPPLHRARPVAPSRALTNFSSTTASSVTHTNHNVATRPNLARLSELARAGSALSVRSNGSEMGEGSGEIERFLEEEARE